MDFSWVKQLADETNKQELARQDKERRDKENNRTMALATCPFVEKLHVVINGACEEFNKHCMFPHLRVSISKLYKHSKSGSAADEPDEVAYFTFDRLGTLFGIRGVNGTIEFLELPVGDTLNAATIKLHELPVSATKRLNAEIEPESQKIYWLLEGTPVDGAAIVSICQKFFIDLIEHTNSEIK